jgi:hypothetical protein
MRGDDYLQEGMYSYISPEKRVPADSVVRRDGDGREGLEPRGTARIGSAY